jgi:hypothetical protein
MKFRNLLTTWQHAVRSAHDVPNCALSDVTPFFCLLQYIGTLDVPRPTSRVEIVAAMRRIRVSGQLVRLHGAWRRVSEQWYDCRTLG